jgi:hypothetical protein
VRPSALVTTIRAAAYESLIVVAYVSIQKFRHELTITTHLVENGLRQQTHHQEMRREQAA